MAERPFNPELPDLELGLKPFTQNTFSSTACSPLVRKSKGPKDIEELERVYYDPCPNKKKEQWASHTQNTTSKRNENDAARILAQFGKCDKIPRGPGKTFDFEIKESKMLAEVTTINPSVDSIQASQCVPRLEKSIKKALGHADEKNPSRFPGYARGAVVYCSPTAELLGIWGMLKDGATLVSKHMMDYALFVPEPAARFGMLDEPQPAAFVRGGKMYRLFQDRLPGYEIVRVPEHLPGAVHADPEPGLRARQNGTERRRVATICEAGAGK